MRKNRAFSSVKNGSQESPRYSCSSFFLPVQRICNAVIAVVKVDDFLGSVATTLDNSPHSSCSCLVDCLRINRRDTRSVLVDLTELTRSKNFRESWIFLSTLRKRVSWITVDLIEHRERNIREWKQFPETRIRRIARQKTRVTAHRIKGRRTYKKDVKMWEFPNNLVTSISGIVEIANPQ